MRDEPGGLAEITEFLHANNINVSNAYGFILKQLERAVLILEVDNFEEAEILILKGGFHTLSMEELHNL